ncbi:hypothetical protein GSS88_00060 [Corynebacterium sp. 3HC-13]|uniref:hypothetical protein n=1 Tax=Corynebacterium poyangense TaxID=2684405 RepID=UPI001CCB9D07|nr:hypothetical protein [Corynebacterium poyangense]MBZ8176203.1 hypothetical protein [Corynebacterium poyangense]
MAIVFLDSAAKHGFTQEDAVYAMNNHSYYLPEFDRSRTGGNSPHLAIGPSLNGEEIEVMFTVEPPSRIVIFHCMLARDKIKKLCRKGERTS